MPAAGGGHDRRRHERRRLRAASIRVRPVGNGLWIDSAPPPVQISGWCTGPL